MEHYLINKCKADLMFTNEVLIEQDKYSIVIKSLAGKELLVIKKANFNYALIDKNKFILNNNTVGALA